MKRWTSAITVLTTVAGAVLLAAAPAYATEVAGATTISAPSVGDGSDRKEVRATCPAGKKVYGAGGYVETVNGGAVIDEMVPSLDLSHVTVVSVESTPLTWWYTTGLARCAEPVRNLQRSSYRTDTDSTSPKNAYAYCPQNLKVYGLGFEIVDAQGKVTVDDLEIDVNLQYVNVGAYEIGAGTTEPWSLVAYAICGNEADTMTRTDAAEPTTGDNPVIIKQAATPSCAPGTTVTGIGGEITGGVGGVSYGRITFGPGGADATARTNGSATPSWSLAVHAVCASSP